MKYYHACSEESLYNILKDKKIKRGFDGLVYLCKKPEEAVRFLIVRGLKEVYVLGVDLNDDTVDESFDHNENFFKCKAYCVDYDIDLNKDTMKDIVGNIFYYQL